MVPRPAPSPFHVDATVHQPPACAGVGSDVGARCAFPGFVAENWWADTDEGTVIIHAEAPAGASGSTAPAEGTITSDDPESPLGRLFGDRQSRAFCSDTDGNAGATCPAGLGDPIGSSFFTGVQLTKCLRRTPGDCGPANH